MERKLPRDPAGHLAIFRVGTGITRVCIKPLSVHERLYLSRGIRIKAHANRRATRLHSYLHRELRARTSAFIVATV